jgi:putative heme iron utilization protein
VLFLCQKSAEEREQERLREEARARAERAACALASVSERGAARPSDEVARLYEAAARVRS